jgi:hypothetical protein
MTASSKQRAVAACALILYFAWLGWGAVPSASSSARLVAVFETDEHDHMIAVRIALGHPLPAINWQIYGHLFFNIALGPLTWLNAFAGVSDRTIIVTLRLVSLASAAAAAFLTFVMASRYWGYAVGWFAMAGLAVLPFSFNYWAVTSHPDTLQVACTTFALYAACRFAEHGDGRWLDAAAIGAGLAFAAKYGGLFLLPCLFVLCVIVSAGPELLATDMMPGTVRRIRAAVLFTGCAGLIISLVLREPYAGVRRIPAQDLQLVASAVLAALALAGRLWLPLTRWPLPVPVSRMVRVISLFWLVFVVTSPFSLHRLSFISGMIFDSRTVAFGQFFAGGGNGLDWIPILASTDSVGVVCLAFAVVAFLGFLLRLARDRGAALVSPEGILWMWIAGSIFFLMWHVRLREHRYLLVVMPPLLILAGATLARLVKRLPRPVAAVLLVVWAGVELNFAAGRQLALRHERRNREQASDTVAAGVWLQGHVPSTARVLYDWYSYVPPRFANVRGSWGMTETELAAYQPDVIVVNDRIRGRFASLSDASRYDSVAGFHARYNLYQSLERGRADYGLVASIGPIRVYGRSTPPGRGPVVRSRP